MIQDRSPAWDLLPDAGHGLDLKRGDRVHYPLAEARVNVAAVAFEIGRGEVDRFADDNGDGAKTQPATAAR